MVFHMLALRDEVFRRDVLRVGRYTISEEGRHGNLAFEYNRAGG